MSRLIGSTAGHHTQSDVIGRVTKWAIEIGTRCINYKPSKAIKYQAFVDWHEAQYVEKLLYLQYWTMFFDGSKNAEGTGARIILISLKGDKLDYALRINFTPCTNNVAEYEALLHGMRATKEMSISRL
jgi:hypothetical protein